jgi:ketosteroid isomerase-like protein
LRTDPETIVRRVIELYNRLPSDPEERAASPELRELLALLSDDIKFSGFRPVDMSTTDDKREFERSWAHWLGMWKSHQGEIDELHVEGNRVLIVSRDHFVARDDLAFDVRACSLYTVEEGRIVRIEVFGEDRDAAWAAFNAAGTNPTS